MSTFSLVVPEEATNLVSNPSGESNTTGFTAGGGSVARSSITSRWGAYSIAYTPSSTTTDGFYSSVSLTNGTTYTFSVYVKGQAGIPYRLYFANNAGTLVGSASTFTGDGAWHRYSVSYTAAASATHRLYVAKNTSANTGVIYTDGWMLTATNYLLTYIDGDQPGCQWTALEHASTSTLSAQYRPGGRIRPFSDYNLTVGQRIGVGMPPVENIALPNSFLDGSTYQRTRIPTRVMSLTGYITASGLGNLQDQRNTVISVLKPNITAQQMPLRLRMTTSGEARDIYCTYDDGLAGGQTSGLFEVLALRFNADDPYWYEDGEDSAALTVQATGAGTYAAMRTASGTWSYFGSNFNARVDALTYDPRNNVLYFGGNFTTANGVSATRLAKYDLSTETMSSIGSASGIVHTLAVDVAGNLYAGGAFTAISATANTARIAKYNGSAWSALGTGANGDVYAIEIGNDGTLYAGGTFSSMGGIANTAKIAKWNGSAWSAMGTGMNSDVYAIRKGFDGYIYIAGAFTTGNSVTLNGVGKWTGTTFAALGTGVAGGGGGLSLATGLDGTLYLGGDFTIAGGVVASGIAQWNGAQWQALGPGFNGDIYALAVDPTTGVLYAGGTFLLSGDSSYTYPCNIAKWNGSRWFPVSAGFDVSAGNVTELAVTRTGTLVGAWNISAGTISNAAVTAVNNAGTADGYPRIVIEGPSSGTAKLYEITNHTTGDSIYFRSDFTLNATEKLTLDLRPGQRSFISTFQGNVVGNILSGSSLSNFRLMPGNNLIGVYSSSSTVGLHAVWQPRYWSGET